MLERLALLVADLLRLLAQLAKERVEQCGVIITEVPRRLGNRKRVEPDEMRGKTLGKRCGEGDAPAGGAVRPEHNQQILVAHVSIS